MPGRVRVIRHVRSKDACAKRYCIGQETVDSLMKSRPYLVIAHRPSTTRRASLVADLKYGRVIERRSHHRLLLKNGAYARLYALQLHDLAPIEGSIA